MLDFENLPPDLSPETVKLLRITHQSMTGIKNPYDRSERPPAASDASELSPPQLIARGLRNGELKNVGSLEGLESYFRAKHRGGAE